MNPSILYEDTDIVVINKPAGLVVHSDGRTEEPTVADWFVNKYPEARGVGETSPRPVPGHPSPKSRRGEGGEDLVERHGVVHRLDRETSGVLLLAKTQKAHEFLKEQFQNREVEKVYHAFVYGHLADDYGSVRLPIGRSASDFRKWSAERGARGEKREAVTYFEVLKRSPDKSWTFVEVKPKTGRTHQIRVHFRALQHPVVADSLYASSRPKLLGFKRLALHARSISFKGLDGESIVVEAPYPEDFKQAIDTEASPVLD